MVVVMELQIRANGTKVTDGMREFIDRRMAKLDRLAEHVVEANLELRTVENRTGAEITTAQLTLHTGRHILRAEESDAEPARAIDAAIDKLIRQVRKFNDKKVSRKKRGSPAAQATDATLAVPTIPLDTSVDGEEDLEVGEDAELVVRTKRFPMKPMLVEEAIDQMELVGHDFFLFHNADEEKLNVLYRRRDGTYGLLAPM
jgi:putative sigma-54 modulation protein